MFTLMHGNCLEKLKKIEDNCIDTIITDPPYGLKFMGKKWDYDVPSIDIWEECLRVLKPGGTALIFAGPRTQHRMAVNIEDAGFIIKDVMMWIFGTGFPKSTDISKKLDQKWNGWKSHGLKPAYEPIIIAMKQNDGTYANNAEKWGVAGLWIDGCKVPADGSEGRYPANIILDEEAGKLLDQQSGTVKSRTSNDNAVISGASRFFYCPKASRKERDRGLDHMPDKIGGGINGTVNGSLKTGSGNDRNNIMKNNHPTVKPLKLMEYLCKLTKTPTGGVVLDPFMGSGTTGLACKNTGRDFIGIEIDKDYFEIAKNRIKNNRNDLWDQVLGANDEKFS